MKNVPREFPNAMRSSLTSATRPQLRFSCIRTSETDQKYLLSSGTRKINDEKNVEKLLLPVLRWDFLIHRLPQGRGYENVQQSPAGECYCRPWREPSRTTDMEYEFHTFKVSRRTRRIRVPDAANLLRRPSLRVRNTTGTQSHVLAPF